MDAPVRGKKTIAVVDDDRDIAELCQTVLLDEGFAVSCLYEPSPDVVKAALAELRPHCVLLDGGGPRGFGASWEVIEWLGSRQPAIPSILLTADEDARREAIIGTSGRARLVAAAIEKPFDIDHFIEVVRTVVGEGAAVPSDAEVAARIQRLLGELGALGVTDIRSSRAGNEWLTFRTPRGEGVFKIYYWRMVGAYFIGLFATNGQTMEPLGQFSDIGALITYVRQRVRSRRE